MRSGWGCELLSWICECERLVVSAVVVDESSGVSDYGGWHVAGERRSKEVDVSSKSYRVLMLDIRQSQSQLPLLREVSALQKIRTLQDPGTSSSISAGSSAGGRKKAKTRTFIGDPHEDAQALAMELSGKLVKTAKFPIRSHGGISRAPKASQRRAESKNVTVDKLQKSRGLKKMASEKDDGEGGGSKFIDPTAQPMKMDVRERIKRLESALGESISTVSGELRKEGLIKELKKEELPDDDPESNEVFKSNDRWEGESARREEFTRKVNSLSQLLGNHQQESSRSQRNLLAMADDEDRPNNFEGESLFESDEEELSPMEMEMSRAHEASPLHRAGLSRTKEQLSSTHHDRKKLAFARPRERSDSIGRPQGGKSSARFRKPPASIILDDDLAFAELLAQRGSGIPWDWSRSQEYGGKDFFGMTELAGAVSESKPPRSVDVNVPTAEHHFPSQSISSLDSDANALPLLIGEDARYSDLGGYYIETRSQVVPQNLKGSGKRKASLQHAVKDVPILQTASTSHSEGPRTLNQKYRPKNFNEIVGQNVAVKSLSTAIVKGKVAPVYLFMGPRGTGKTSAARVFAAGLNCLSPDRARRPCGICRECGTMKLNRSADVRQIDAASNIDAASMRAMMGSFTPHAQYKVFIVEGCDLLSSDIWNAFLKVLEEPPRNVVFILITTDAERIPSTAFSRCQKFHFSKLKDADIVSRLELLATKEDLHVEVGALDLIAARSDGSLRDAEIFLDQLCLLDRNVSISSVHELVGLLPNNKTLELLDYALSADAVHTVRTMREVLISGVEPLSLVSQLGALITDILAGSFDLHQEARKEGFFNRNLSVKQEHLRLREALKILSEAEKQLRVSTDQATWLTAALLQFAPDRSFLPSEINTSAASSPVSTAPAVDYSVSKASHPSLDEPDQTQAPEITAQSQALQMQVENRKVRSAEAKIATSSEKNSEEAWTREQRVSTDGVAESAEIRRPSEVSMEYQVFGNEALAELWKRVIQQPMNRNLKHLLQTQGRLVAAAVFVDGTRSVVELEFDHARDKHKAERSWRSICIALQAVLSTAVELRIALSAVVPEDPNHAPTGETIDDMQPGPSTEPKNKGIVDEGANADVQMAVPPRSRRRRGAKTRRRHHAIEIQETEVGATQESSEISGINLRRLPPRRRRKAKRSGGVKLTKQVSLDIGLDYRQGSSSFGGEVWDSGVGSMEMKSCEKKPLSTMMEEPQSEIEDLQSAKQKILKQRAMQYRNNPALMATIEQRNSLFADLQRGLPIEGSFCWKRETPKSEFLMRKMTVKSVRKASGSALLLKWVPCRTTRIGRDAAPPLAAPISAA